MTHADSVPQLPDDLSRHQRDPARRPWPGALRPLPDAVRRARTADRRRRRRRGAIRPLPATAAAPTRREQIEVEEPEAQEDITLEGRHIEISGTYRVARRRCGEASRRSGRKSPKSGSRSPMTTGRRATPSTMSDEEVLEGELTRIAGRRHRRSDRGDRRADASTTTERRVDRSGSPTDGRAPHARQRRAPAKPSSTCSPTPTRAPPRACWKFLAAPLALLLAAADRSTTIARRSRAIRASARR